MTIRASSTATTDSNPLIFTSYNFSQNKARRRDTEPLRNAAAPGEVGGPESLRSQVIIGNESVPEQPSGQTPVEGRPVSSTELASNSTLQGELGKPDGSTERNSSQPGAQRRLSTTTFLHSPPTRVSEIPETQPLTIPTKLSGEAAPRTMRYGSIVGTPPENNSQFMSRLELPDPVISNADKRSRRPEGAWEIPDDVDKVSGGSLDSDDAYHVGRTTHPPRPHNVSLHRGIFHRRRSTPMGTAPSARLPDQRMVNAAPTESHLATDVRLSLYRELDAKQEDFFNFLDNELEKIESFYKMKEQQATQRLEVLRQQLHEMRDRRMDELVAKKQGGNSSHDGSATADHSQHVDGYGVALLKPFKRAFHRDPHIGKTSKAMEQLGSPPGPSSNVPEERRDYVRRHTLNEHVPYRAAKRKLKLALQEYYRGLELLKSYALLNRTGFRKLNKKYDKAVNARPTLRYMSEKVNKAYFVKSYIIEGHIVSVEDLYARYFERGNHKIAVTKLRSLRKYGDCSANTFRGGLLVAGGLVLGIQGLVYGADHLSSSDSTLSIRTSYLLQLYAGYFLSLLLFIFFVLACRTWTASKVNYIFVFEYDTRHVLDWRQLAELPCLFFFLNGLFLWLNFRQPVGTDSLFLYWPAILIGVTLLILALPAPILYHRARIWWAYSNWRLLLSGVYPVEFRDFFLGDMYCSETYVMGNISLFFCLYAQNWSQPPQCNSSHSRLIGFFSTLPGIWRAFQCLRRYYDSRNWFPHLANCGKYLGNILYYMTLSLYRIHKVESLRAVFILFATVNAVYCSFWDVAMDWSLGNPYARHPFLRENLAYRRIWVYYVATVLDPILRFQWIFYALFAADVQHSAILSFFVALAEVFRRGMWMLFRVESEHCNNVGRFRASRDVPLPYSFPPTPKDSQETQQSPSHVESLATMTTGADVESTPQTAGSSLRPRKTWTMPDTPVERAMRRVGSVIVTAHAQDYEKKRRPGVLGESPESTGMLHPVEDSDEENDGMGSDEGNELMEAQRMISRGEQS